MCPHKCQSAAGVRANVMYNALLERRPSAPLSTLGSAQPFSGARSLPTARHIKTLLFNPAPKPILKQEAKTNPGLSSGEMKAAVATQGLLFYSSELMTLLTSLFSNCAPYQN